MRLDPVLHSKRGYCSEKPAHRNEEQLPLTATRESLCTAMKTQHSQKYMINFKIHTYTNNPTNDFQRKQKNVNVDLY